MSLSLISRPAMVGAKALSSSICSENRNLMIPTLETERLIFRAFKAEDAEAYHQCCADPEVMQYLGEGERFNREETWNRIAFFLGHWQLRAYGMWAVENKLDRQFVGRIGFHQPLNWPGLEIGWLIRKKDWDKGYATEGAQMILDYGREQMKLRDIISLIQPQNIPSMKVAEKIGGRGIREIIFAGKRNLKYAYE